jgi:hypothetical protein
LAPFLGSDILSAKYLAVSLSSVGVSDYFPGKGDSKTSYGPQIILLLFEV